jgi:hypothetical protein
MTFSTICHPLQHCSKSYLRKDLKRNQLINSFSDKVLKGKWQNLEDKFLIEVNKTPVSRSGTENVDCTSKWPVFDVMFFVKDFTSKHHYRKPSAFYSLSPCG